MTGFLLIDLIWLLKFDTIHTDSHTSDTKGAID